MRKSRLTRGNGIFISIVSLVAASLLFIFSQVLVEAVWADASSTAKASKPQAITPVALVYSQQKTADVSTVCDFSRLTAIEEWQRAALTKGGELEQITSLSAARYQAGLTKLKNAAEYAKASIIAAQKAFKEDPSQEREADLARVNAEALANQFKPLDEYGLASQSQLKTLGVFLETLKNGKTRIEAQIDEMKQERETSLEKLAQAEGLLVQLSANMHSLVGPTGELDPALAAMLEELERIRDDALQASLEADVVQGQLEGQLREIGLLERRLLKKRDSLKHSADAAVLVQAHIVGLLRLRSRWENDLLYREPWWGFREQNSQRVPRSRYPCPIGPR